MELRHLRYFIAVACARSFTRAADQLHVTQPTLSHQIKQLEQRVGTTLFARGGKDVELTAAGRLFKPYCERILKEVDASALAISELEGLMRGTLRMAVFHSFSHSMLPPILSEFALRYPGVQVTARLVPRADMERELINGALDCAVAYVSDDNEHIESERLFDEELVLVVGSGHILAADSFLPMRGLVKLPLVLLTPEFGARQFVDRFFAEARLKPHIILEMNAIEPILATIRDSGLASVLAAGAIVDTTGLHIVHLTKPVPKRTVAILWRRNGHRSTAALRMAEMVRAAYRERGNAIRERRAKRQEQDVKPSGGSTPARCIDAVYRRHN